MRLREAAPDRFAQRIPFAAEQLGRRRAYVRVSATLLQTILTCPELQVGRFAGITSDAPKDLKIIGCEFDAFGDEIKLVCTSQTFRALAEGEPAPQFTPTFKSHYLPLDETAA